MCETCRECRPRTHYQPHSGEAVYSGEVTLCPKHSEVDALRKEVERLREAAQAVIADWEYDPLVALKPINALKDALGRRG